MSEFSDEAMQSYPFADITLPLGWSLVALEKVSSDVSPGFASGKHNSDGTGVPHLRPMNVDRDGQIDLKVIKSVATSNGIELRQGDVLFNNTNSAELVGKTAVVSAREGGFAFSNHMTRIRPEDGVNSVFVARQLHFLWMAGYMKHRCTNHVNQASISSKTLAKTIPFHLPPTAEQTRIVAKLEELLTDLDAGVAELKGAQKKLAQYRQSLLKAAMDGALTAEWRANNTPAESGAQLLECILQERRACWEAKQLAKFTEQGKTPPKDWHKKYPEPVRPDITDLPKLPEWWVWASVDQLTVEQKYGSSSKTNENPTGVPVLRMGNIQDGCLDFSNLKYLPVDHAEFPSLHLQDGDLLFNRTNSPELVGKTAVYRSQISPCSFASYLISVRFSAGYIPEIASAFINSAYGKRWIKSVVVQQVGQANVNGSKLSALAVPLPPFQEQQEIVSVLQAQASEIVDQLKSVDISLKQSNAQRQNILRAAFAGLLVPQDPNDEPASALLERIRAERAERVKQPKTRKTKPKEIAIMVSQLIDVLAQAGDWVPAQDAFRRCGVADGALTERIEELYAELRKLDKAGRLAVEAVTDAQGRKLYDKLKLLAG
ncbi:restriction endonuclease subunit S [Pseudomonas asplenii]|uniref:restriction endonuclease subunit S n=1 Tax=Pseudomonas asplenii TaxID=53407 RepID=UPI0037CB1969